MGTVYVLTSLIGEGKHKEWRPVAVVTSADTADQWAQSGNDNDWIPFELDDVSTTGMANVAPFKPREPVADEQKADETIQRLEAANKRLLKIIEQLQQQKPKRSAKSALLNKKIVE